MPKVLIYAVVAILILAGGYFLISNDAVPQTGNVPEDIISEGGETVEANFDPVSLPALMEKEFDGRDLKLGNVLDDNSAYTKYFATYESGDLTISGVMYIPKTAVPAGGFPVLILNHGHIDTSIYTNGRGLRREQDYLARQGFAVLHPDYRNHAQSDKDEDNETNVRLGYIEDVINAVLAVKNSDLANLNKNKIGMLGHSMGGGITQAVMVVKPELVNAFVLYAPVSSDVVDSYNRWTLMRREIAAKIDEIHGSPQDNPEFWRNLSPRTFFDKVSGPVMIFHGTADDSCEIDWSRTTRDLLVAAGKKAELVEYPGQPHEFTTVHPDFMAKTAQFFRDNL
jgi:dipeptidyl aminopeptidase/acylaminoacyl peptidase